ncbi:MAG: hypothetical protein Q4D04_01635, partial [Clostridia bacterium]|nr:hypothetical protein [Clostridia bacterium]
KILYGILVFTFVIGITMGGMESDTSIAIPTSGPYSLNTELQQCGEAFAALYNLDKKSAMSVAEKYVPDGSSVLDVTSMGLVVHVDYKLNNARHIVTYRSDGSVYKVSRGIGDDKMVSADSATNVLKFVSVSDRASE